MTAIITHWSYTKYSAYAKCPFQAACKHRKVKVPGTQAQGRGIAVHEAGDKYIRGAGKLNAIPEDFRCVAKHIKEFRKERYETEELLGLSKQWKLVKRKDDPYVPGTWFWIKMDFFKNYGSVAHGGDWKTGRIYEDTHRDQAELSAITMAALAPEARAFEFDIYYLDQAGHNQNYFWEADYIPRLRTKWKRAVGKMLRDEECLPTPGQHCRWCEYNVANGGPCEVGKRYK